MIPWYNPTMDEHSVNRRQWLKATGVGASVAFGTTAASAGSTVRAIEPTDVETTVADPITEFDAAIERVLFAFDADSVDDEPIELEPGDLPDGLPDDLEDLLEIGGEVLNDATWEADAISITLDFDTETLTVERGDETDTIDFDFDELVVELLDEFGDELDLDDLPIDIPEDIDLGGDVVVKIGDAQFPDEAFGGPFRQDEELLEADIGLDVDVDIEAEVSVPVIGSIDIDVAVGFGAAAVVTTGESGELEGNIDPDLDSEEVVVTLVSNDFIVPEIGEPIELGLPSIPGVDLPDEIDLDEELGLPSPEGRNYLELELDMTFDEVPDMDGDLEIEVVDAQANRLEDVDVEVVNSWTGEEFTGQTDEDGIFELDGLHAGEFEVFLDGGEDFKSASETTTLFAQEQTTDTFQLELENPDDAVFSGTVVDPDGEPISGVEVSIEDTRSDSDLQASAVTDENGEFTMAVTLDGGFPVTFRIYIEEVGYQPVGDENIRSVSLERGIAKDDYTIELDALQGLLNGTLFETVGDATFSVADVDVDITRISGTDEVPDEVENPTTDEDGEFGLIVPVGVYEIAVETDGQYGDNEGKPMQATKETAIEFGDEREVELELQPLPAIVSGILSGNSLTSGTIDFVETETGERETVSVEDNSFEAELQSGTYAIEVYDQPNAERAPLLLTTYDEIITVDTDETVDGLEIEVPEMGTVSGMLDSEEEAIELAEISITNADDTVSIEEDWDMGESYELILPAGEYTITASATVDDETVVATRVVTLEPGDSVDDFDIMLSVGPAAIGPFDTPVDLNGDGLYEGTRGDEQLSVAEVQALFDYKDEIPESEASFFNFSGLNNSEVTIFDVQALYNRFQNKGDYDIPE